MLKVTFQAGGVHPPENKFLTEHKPIEKAKLPKRVVIPLIQHIGAPAKAIVNIGDRVKKGQVVAEAGGFVSVPVHSSISGKVSAIGDFPHPFGKNLPAIVIENDNKEEWDESVKPSKDIYRLFPDEIRVIIRDAGIVGMGGAGFPTHIKITPPKEKDIEILILNGVECEPYLTTDDRLMVEETKRVVKGFEILMKCLEVLQGYIGVEANKPEAIIKVREELKKVPNATLIELKVKYPQGAEKQLIKAITDREVPSGGLPMDVGVLVQNVGTAAAVYDAIVNGIPLIERVLTVSGKGIKEPKNLLVRIGTLFSDLIEECGGLTGDVAKVVMGGPMMGLAQYSLDVPVIKGTSGILCLTKDEIELEERSNCIRCGQCIESCPIKLMPTTIAAFSEYKRFNDAEDYNALDCIECGCCSYTCPAKIPLVHLIRSAKTEIMLKNRREKEEKK